MILNVKVIPRVKISGVQELSANCLKVRLRSPPVDNKANKELAKIISEHYKVKISQVSIIRGEHSHNKVVEIKEEKNA